MTITIGADTFEAYGSIAGLATYANGSTVFYATYAAATSDGAKRALVEASRLLDRQSWQGARVSAAPALAWPRTGVVDAAGGAVSSATVPDDIVSAAYELALAGLADAAALSLTSHGKNIASVGAGSASVSFFAPVTGGRFPARVLELIGWAFAGAEGSTSLSGTGGPGSYASGTDGVSAFDACDTYGLTGPA